MWALKRRVRLSTRCRREERESKAQLLLVYLDCGKLVLKPFQIFSIDMHRKIYIFMYI